jgi:hypothetical protein
MFSSASFGHFRLQILHTGSGTANQSFKAGMNFTLIFIQEQVLGLAHLIRPNRLTRRRDQTRRASAHRMLKEDPLQRQKCSNNIIQSPAPTFSSFLRPLEE